MKNGVEIISDFYEDILVENPDIRQMFNMDRQGSEQQIQALAQTALNTAENIDDWGALSSAGECIAKRHVKSQVKEEQSLIIERYLLQSIQSILGDDATPIILSAGGDAY